MDAEQRLNAAQWKLPTPPSPVGSYVQAVQSGALLFVAGQLPTSGATLAAEGRVGDELSQEEGQAAMRQAALNALAVVRAELGSLNRVRRVVRLVAHVASEPDFHGQAAVANAASEVFAEVFGPECGRHARLALGAVALPKRAPVELEVIVEVKT